jgi:hypothetical protein
MYWTTPSQSRRCRALTCLVLDTTDLAVGKEGVRHDLTCLASRGIRTRSEVREVIGTAGLPRPTARIPIYQASVR